MPTLYDLENTKTWFDGIGQSKKLSLKEAEDKFRVPTSGAKSLAELEEWTPKKQAEEDKKAAAAAVMDMSPMGAGSIGIKGAKNLGGDVAKQFREGYKAVRKTGILDMKPFSDEWFEANEAIHEATKRTSKGVTRGVQIDGAGNLVMPHDPSQINVKGRARRGAAIVKYSPSVLKSEAPELIKAYPQLKDVQVILHDAGSTFSPTEKIARLNINKNKGDLNRAFGHEVGSHAVQDIEGHPTGASFFNILRNEFGYTNDQANKITSITSEVRQDIADLLTKSFGKDKVPRMRTNSLTSGMVKMNQLSLLGSKSVQLTKSELNALKVFSKMKPGEEKNKITELVNSNIPEFTAETNAVQRYYNAHGELMARAEEAFSKDVQAGKTTKSLMQYAKEDEFVDNFSDITINKDYGADAYINDSMFGL